MPIQVALLDALHEQPAGAVTATGAVPPTAPIFRLGGEIEYEHPAPCVTVNVCPPAVMVAARSGPALAAAA
jgi:hypothetical protein